MLRPKDAGLYYDRGRAWHKKRGYDKAIDDFSQAIALRPYYSMAFASRGATWNAKKAYDQALADFNTVIRLEPDHPRGYNARAWLQATCPDAKHRSGTRAFESATRACSLSAWKVPEFLDTLAAACARRAILMRRSNGSPRPSLARTTGSRSRRTEIASNSMERKSPSINLSFDLAGFLRKSRKTSATVGLSPSFRVKVTPSSVARGHPLA